MKGQLGQNPGLMVVNWCTILAVIEAVSSRNKLSYLVVRYSHEGGEGHLLGRKSRPFWGTDGRGSAGPLCLYMAEPDPKSMFMIPLLRLVSVYV